MFEIIDINELLRRLAQYNYKEGQFHHTWSPNKTAYDGSDASAQRLQQGMKTYHMNTMHWSDIGQHVTLLTDGRFITGRPFGQTPASILGYNTGAFACETLGNFDAGFEVLTGPQKDSALRLAKYFDDKGLYFRFHRENAAKTCPGSGIDKGVFMAQARGQVMAPSPVSVHPGNELVRQLQELEYEAGLKGSNGSVIHVDGVWGTQTQWAAPTLKLGITKTRPDAIWIVKFLQKRLLAIGYPLPKYGADGDYGAETVECIKSYQRDHFLVPDGVVGSITWTRLLGV
jgi:hypothetical protein